MRPVLALALLAALLGTPAMGEDGQHALLYKDPQCGCCSGYAYFLRKAGFDVEVIDTEDMTPIKREHGVPESLAGCHTTVIDGYVIEGHVPLEIVDRLLKERPPIAGISLPGMPEGSPGMGGDKTEPFTIYEIGPGEPRIYALD